MPIPLLKKRFSLSKNIFFIPFWELYNYFLLINECTISKTQIYHETWSKPMHSMYIIFNVIHFLFFYKLRQRLVNKLNESSSLRGIHYCETCWLWYLTATVAFSLKPVKTASTLISLIAWGWTYPSQIFAIIIIIKLQLMLSCGVQHSLKFDVAKQNKLLNFQAFLKTLRVAKKGQKFFGILIAIIGNTSSWGFSL